MATTAWDTTANCDTVYTGDCLGNTVSGVLPLVFDNAASPDYTANTGGSIGGSPIFDGPFSGFNFEFNITDMTLTDSDPHASIGTFCDFDPTGGICTISAVPVPAAVWLFGSGLLTLFGFARTRKHNMS